MRTKRRVLLTGGIALAMMLGIGLFLTPGGPSAEEKDTESVRYNLNLSFLDNLVIFKGKKVYVTLSSGSTLLGTVKEVKNGMLHLEKLSNRSYYDALILIDDISAVDAQFRGM